MKIVGIVAATAALTLTACAANEAVAMDLGNGLSVGGEVETSYTTSDTDNWGLDFTPEVGFEVDAFAFTAETTFDMLELNNEAIDRFTGVDFEATYGISNNLEAFGEISTDNDWEFGDLTVGTRLSF